MNEEENEEWDDDTEPTEPDPDKDYDARKDEFGPHSTPESRRKQREG